jgi:glycosidase
MVKWWKQTAFYEIYMPSFKDGNGDGIGDFAGITSKLDYLKDLGINGLWLTPFYPSPKVDNGYDISDYYGIDPAYGEMEDFETFISEAHRRNIKVIIDLVLNHTSSEHPWFKESRSSRNHPKRNWYIWRDKPNNWESFFSGSSWEYDEATDQYYYHAFAKEQVDLNWANTDVKKAMFDVMKFWLEKGVDGFRLDVINFLKVNDSFQDNPYNHEKNEQIHLFDKDQEGILAVIKEIAELVHQYPDKFLVGEVGSEDIEILKRYSGTGKMDVSFNFNIGSIDKFNAEQIYSQLVETEQAYESDQMPTLFFSSHDMSRHISRFGGDEERGKLIAALMLTAKGVPFIYQGDEIGMNDWIADDISMMMDVQGRLAYEKAISTGKSKEEALVVANERCRDKSRTPMQWSPASYAGFSKVRPWISVPDESCTINVQNQQGNPDSMLSFYKRLLKLRMEHSSLRTGEYEFIDYQDGMLSFMRTNEFESTWVALNFSEEEKTLNIEAERVTLLLSNKRKSIECAEALAILPNEALILRRILKNDRPK